MGLLRPIGVGLLAFPVFVGVTAATAPSALLLVGVPVGVLVGVTSDGLLGALRNGLLAGVGSGGLLLVAVYLLVMGQERTAPGVGLSIAFMALVAVLVCIESSVSALVARAVTP